MIPTPNSSIFFISVLWAQISRNSFICGPQRASAGPKSKKNVRPAAAGSNPSISFIFRALVSRDSFIFGPPRASAGPKSKKKNRPATSSRLKSKHFLQIPGSGPNIKEFLHFPASAGSISRNSYISVASRYFGRLFFRLFWWLPCTLLYTDQESAGWP